MSSIPAFVALVLVAGEEKDCFVSHSHFESVCCFRDSVKRVIGYLTDLEQSSECCGHLYKNCPGRVPMPPTLGSAFVPAVGMEVVTVADNLERARPLFMEVPFPLRVLGSADNRYHPTYKPQLLHDFVRGLVDSGRGSTLVVLVDAFDVAWMGCDADLVGTFNRWGRPLFVSAERHIWPFNNSFTCVNRFASRVMPEGCDMRIRKTRKAKSPSNGQRGCFPNSGCWGGVAANLDEMLSELYVVGVNGRYELAPEYKKILEPLVHTSLTQEKGWSALEDDQAHLYAYIYAHPYAVWIDQTAEICTNLYGMQTKHFSLSRPGRMIWAHPFQRHVCFAHANGGEWSLLKNLRRSRMLEKEPMLLSMSQPYLRAEEFGTVFRAPAKTAYIDLGQCFTHHGMISDVMFNLGSRMSFVSISFNLYRPLLGENGICSKYQLIAGTRHFSVGRFDGEGEIAPDRHDLFFDMKHAEINFEPGDCFGWQIFNDSYFYRTLNGTDYEGTCLANVDAWGFDVPLGTIYPFERQADNLGRWSIWAMTT